ncbi:ubiquitin C-terminal hydrolase 12-like [Nymphaea colorata]|nr:ubiquitin C-terminal hydrolase 12-like [Nymphaea colorata]
MTSTEQRPVGKLFPTRFIWKIDNFSKMNKEKYYSDVFVVGGCRWKLLIFPNVRQNKSSLGLFLGIADSSTQPDGWSVEAEHSLAVINQLSKKIGTIKDFEHKFTAQEKDWGHRSILALSDLRSPEKGYLVNDSCLVEVGISVQKTVGYRMYDDGESVEAAAQGKQKSGALETVKKMEDASASPKQKPDVDEKPESRVVQTVPPDSLLPTNIPQHRRSRSIDGYQKGVEGYGSEREVNELAYRFVLQSLHLQGDHKWKNEVWLTELRGALGISNDDHIMQLKRVLYGECIPASRPFKE